MEHLNVTHSDREIDDLIKSLQTRPASILCLDLCQFTSVFLVRNLLSFLPTSICLIVREGETTPGWTDKENTVNVLDAKKDDNVKRFVLQKVKRLHVLWQNKGLSDVLHIPELMKGAFLTIQPINDAKEKQPAIELILDSTPYSILLVECNLSDLDYKHVFTGVTSIVLDNCSGLEKMCNNASIAVFGVESVVINRAVNPQSLIKGVFARVKKYVSFLDCAFVGSPVFQIKTSASLRMVHCSFEEGASLQINDCGPLLFLAFLNCPISFSANTTSHVEALAVLDCDELSNPCPIIFQFRENMRLLYFSLKQSDPTNVQSISKVCGQRSDYLETLILQNVGTVDRIINAPKLKALMLCNSSVADHALSLPKLGHVFLRGESKMGEHQRDISQKLVVDKNDDMFCFDDLFVDVCGQLFIRLTCPW